MKQVDMLRIQAQIKDEFSKTLTKAFPTIIENYELQLEAHGEEENDRKFNFLTPATISITCVDPTTYHVGVKIATRVKNVFESEIDVKIGHDMVDEMNRAAADEEQADPINRGGGNATTRRKPAPVPPVVGDDAEIVDLDQAAAKNANKPPRKPGTGKAAH